MPTPISRSTLLPLIVATALGLSACAPQSADALLAAAQQDLQKSDHRAAQIKLKNALALEGNRADVRLLLARSLLADTQAAQAAVELLKAKEQGAQADVVLPLLAQARFRQGDFRRLLQESDDLQLASNPAQAELLAWRASAQQALNQRDAAAATLEQAKRLDPDNLRVGLLEARQAAMAQRLDEAGRITDRLATRSDAGAEVWLLKADLAAAAGQREAQAEALNKALAIDARNLVAHTGLFHLALAAKDFDRARKQLAQAGKLWGQHPHIAYLGARLALEQGQLAQAREQIQRALKDQPDDLRVLSLAALVEQRLGALTRAEQLASKALARNPDAEGLRLFTARLYLSRGDRERALSTLQPLLTAGSREAAVYSAAGEAELLGGRQREAEAHFRRALELAPGDARSRTALGEGKLLRGEVGEGLNLLREVSKDDEGIQADLALFSRHLQANDLAAAEQAAQTVLRKQPKNPLAHLLLADVHMARSEPEAARKALQAAIDVAPTYVPAHVKLNLMDLQAGKPAAAVQRLEAVVKAHPDSMALKLNLAGLRADTGVPREEVLTQLREIVRQHPADPLPRLALLRLGLAGGDKQKLLTDAEEADAALPNQLELLDLLGQAYALNNKPERALQTFNRMLALAPNSPQPYLRLAEVHRALPNGRQAWLDNLRKALVIDPRRVDVQRTLVMDALEQKQPEQARKLVQELRERRPKDALPYVMAGDVEMLLKQFDRAAAAYREALKHPPALSETALKLHQALQQTDQPAQADAFAQTWLRERPDDRAFRIYLADQALRAGRLAEAESQYRTLLAADAQQLMVLNNLAWVLGQQRKPEAKTLIEQALKLSPGQPTLLDTQASIHAALGEWSEAVRLQRQVVERAATLPSQLNLARYLAGEGRKDDARALLEKLKKPGLGSAEAALIERELKKL